LDGVNRSRDADVDDGTHRLESTRSHHGRVRLGPVGAGSGARERCDATRRDDDDDARDATID